MYQGYSSQAVRGGDYARYVELAPLDTRCEEWQGGIVPIGVACYFRSDGYLEREGSLRNLRNLGKLRNLV